MYDFAHSALVWVLLSASTVGCFYWCASLTIWKQVIGWLWFSTSAVDAALDLPEAITTRHHTWMIVELLWLFAGIAATAVVLDRSLARPIREQGQKLLHQQ